MAKSLKVSAHAHAKPRVQSSKQPGARAPSAKVLKEKIAILASLDFREQSLISEQAVKNGIKYLPDLIDALSFKGGANIFAAGEIISKIGFDAIPLLIGNLGHQDQMTQNALIDILARFGEPAVMPLLHQLQSESQLVVGNARATIKRIGLKACPSLRIAANPDHPAYSSEGINLLIEVDPEAPMVMMEQLASSLASPDQNESAMASQAMVKIGKPAVDVLCGMMEDANPYAQQNSTNTIIGIGKSGIPRLIELLGTNSQFGQQNAIRALEQIGQPAIPELLEAAKGDNPLIRDNASKILGVIGVKKRSFFSRG